VELLRRAATLAEQGIQAAFAAAAPGATERELASVVAATMAAGGGEPRFVVVTAGARSALSDARPTDLALTPGDLLRLDVGCTVDGYWSDTARTAVLGDPDDLQSRRYAALLAGEQRQLESARPGVRACELFRVAVDAVEAAGIRPYRRHHCGHAIGGEVYERPIVAPATDDVLRKGMVLCVETPFYELGWGGMMVEDTIAVTEQGVDLLTTADRSLRVIPT
jgi:Xaa-Pro aminopeptidase